MLTKACGLDPSLRGFGVSSGKETIVIATEPSDLQTTSQNCQRRCQEIIAKIVAFVNRNYDPDDIIMFVLEGPSFSSHGHGYEVGFLYAELYNRLINMINRPCTICEIPPGTLKKWTAGNGRADKDQMKAAIKEKWGVEFEQDRGGNKADAFALYKYGVAILEKEIDFKPTLRRGQGKKQVAKRKAKKNAKAKTEK